MTSASGEQTHFGKVRNRNMVQVSGAAPQKTGNRGAVILNDQQEAIQSKKTPEKTYIHIKKTTEEVGKLEAIVDILS